MVTITHREANMELNVEQKNSVVIVSIKGEFHIGNVNKFEELWHGLIEKKPEVIAINCKELEYIDSSAIGTLVKFLNNAMSKKIKLIFFDLNAAIQNIFKTARLDNFFTITTREKVEREYL
jgi:anti-sigma B factor antagonist